MALTSLDETDLLLPLYRGLQEAERFSTFLNRVRQRTRAEYIGIVVRKSGGPLRDATEFYSGLDLRKMAQERGLEKLFTLQDIFHEGLRPGRVYATSDFTDNNPAYKAQRMSGIERLGIVDERLVLVSETAGISVWLILARSRLCTAADSALLSSLAPYVAAVMSAFVDMESQHMDMAMAVESLERASLGWMLLDADGQIVSFDPQSAARLEEMTGIEIRQGERLRNVTRKVADDLARYAQILAGSNEEELRSVILSEDPRIEALLMCANDVQQAGLQAPAMLAVYRLNREASPARIGRLAQLFNLPAREAELAIALADGLSIAQAAKAMGLTQETARNYSKRIYAKLGVNGQTQLIGRIYQSTAVLA